MVTVVRGDTVRDQYISHSARCDDITHPCRYVRETLSRTRGLVILNDNNNSMADLDEDSGARELLWAAVSVERCVNVHADIYL